jgi:hypothetical protein
MSQVVWTLVISNLIFCLVTIPVLILLSRAHRRHNLMMQQSVEWQKEQTMVDFAWMQFWVYLFPLLSVFVLIALGVYTGHIRWKK